MRILSKQMLETEKLLLDFEYNVVDSEKKKKAQRHSLVLKRVSLLVLILFVILWVAGNAYAFVRTFQQDNENIFKFSHTNFVPAVDLLDMEANNIGCSAFLLILSLYDSCVIVWLLVTLLISSLGFLCCIIGKTPITETFDLSSQRQEPRLTKITPIRGIIIAISTLTIVYAVLAVFLISKITFPAKGIEVEWLFVDTTVMTATQYIAIHLMALFLSVFVITNIALGPFVYYYFSEKKQAKKQLEYEVLLGQYIAEKNLEQQDIEMVEANYRENKKSIIETKICNLCVGEQHREEEVINQYACFGWRIVGKSIENRTMSDESSYVSKVSLTFQRNTGIRNYGILNILFEKYLIEENKIARAKCLKKNDKAAFVSVSVVFTIILLPILLPLFVGLELGIVMDVMGIVVTICGGCLFGALLGALPVSVKNQKKIDRIIKPAVYRNMHLIANKARTYL